MSLNYHPVGKSKQLTPFYVQPNPLPHSRIFSKAHEKYFFVYDLKRTTWVDPRDELWKKKTWSECNSNETPYGWEIATDELLGTFFIDHLSHRNVIDDPRTDILQRQIKSVKLFLDESSIIDLEEMRRAVESTTLTESGESSPQTPSSLLQASFIKLVKEKHGIICRGLQQVKEVVAIVEADVIDQLNSQKITQLEINSNKEILAKSLESRTELLQKINCSMSPVAPASASTVVSAETKMVEIEQSNSTTATTTNAPATAAPSYTTLVKKGLINKATKRLITRMEREIENIVVKARLDLIVNQLDLLQIANESQCGMEEDMMEEINQTSFPLFDKVKRKSEWCLFDSTETLISSPLFQLQTIVKCT